MDEAVYLRVEEALNNDQKILVSAPRRHFKSQLLIDLSKHLDFVIVNTEINKQLLKNRGCHCDIKTWNEIENEDDTKGKKVGYDDVDCTRGPVWNELSKEGAKIMTSTTRFTPDDRIDLYEEI